MNTIHYISYGLKTKIELDKSIKSLKNTNNSYNINIISELNCKHELDKDNIINSRYSKTTLNQYQTEKNIYLDSDTTVLANINILFELLDTFDLVICLSSNQSIDNKYWHVSDSEKQYTYDLISNQLLQYQCGVFSWRKCVAMDNLFTEWHKQWLIYKGQDQAAFSRALDSSPVKLYILGNSYNSSNGSVIAHNFGKIR